MLAMPSSLPLIGLDAIRDFMRLAILMRDIKALGSILLLAGSCGYSIPDIFSSEGMKDLVKTLMMRAHDKDAECAAIEIVDVVGPAEAVTTATPTPASSLASADTKSIATSTSTSTSTTAELPPYRILVNLLTPTLISQILGVIPSCLGWVFDPKYDKTLLQFRRESVTKVDTGVAARASDYVCFSNQVFYDHFQSEKVLKEELVAGKIPWGKMTENDINGFMVHYFEMRSMLEGGDENSSELITADSHLGVVRRVRRHIQLETLSGRYDIVSWIGKDGEKTIYTATSMTLHSMQGNESGGIDNEKKKTKKAKKTEAAAEEDPSSGESSETEELRGAVVDDLMLEGLVLPEGSEFEEAWSAWADHILGSS
jgi:hypothetical protein